jgi:hypothetical protein
VNYKLNCPAWYKPYAEILFEADFDRLLRILAAGTEAAVFQRHWESAADQAASRLFCAPSCAQVFSSGEKHVDRRISSFLKRR